MNGYPVSRVLSPNSQLLIDGHGVEGAAEPVVGPAHVEQLGALVGRALPVARHDHVRAPVHHLQ